MMKVRCIANRQIILLTTFFFLNILSSRPLLEMLLRCRKSIPTSYMMMVKQQKYHQNSYLIIQYD